MRILRIVSGSDTGGVFTCETQFIKEFKNQNIIIDIVISGEGKNSQEYKKLGNKIYHLPALNYLYSGSILNILNSILQTYLFGAKYAKQLKSQINGDIKYDAIIYQKPTFIHLAGILSKMLKTKGMWQIPNVSRTSFSKKFYNYFSKKYEIIQVANSIYTKSTLGEQCKYVVYPGFDDTRVVKSDATYRLAFNIPDTAPVYGIAARMDIDKAQDRVVEAFVKSDVPEAGGHLLIAGGPLDTEYGKLVQAKAGSLLNKQIHFLGEMKNMPEFYSSVDVIINGRRNAEPFGISVAEAFGASKPVMAYYLGGPSEMIQHTVNGWLIQEPSVENYTATFNQSLNERDKWLVMGKNAKSSSPLYSIQLNANKLIDIIYNKN